MLHTVEGAPREFLSVAVRITVASGGKDGFSVQLFPDLRPPQTIFVTTPQLERLLELAEGETSEAEIWAELAKIPLEPLQPARSLYPRLKHLLVDQLHALREEVAQLKHRVEQRAMPAPEPPVEIPH